jgi:hypothetical protein
LKGDTVRAGIGERDDGEPPFRHGEELGELAIRRPAVSDSAYAVDVAQEPADAESVTQRAASQRDGWLFHPMQHLGGQNLRVAFRPAVTEMEPGPAQLVAHRGGHAPAGVTTTWASP